MKKNWFVGFLVVGLFVSNLLAQNEAWRKLQTAGGVRELFINKSNTSPNNFRIRLDSLRNALNRAGINENIKMEISFSNSLIIEHGRNSIVVQGGRFAVIGAASGIVVQGGREGIIILGEFQPSASPRGANWSTIPDFVEIQLNGKFDQSKNTIPARLVLKNSAGQIKGSWNINFRRS